MSTLQQSVTRRRADLVKSDGHVCYSTLPQASALLLEATGGDRWVLPWMHFVFARHQSSDDSEQLLFMFASHEVLVRGANLGSLASEAAAGGLESLRELPGKYRDRQGDDPFVESISVRAVADDPVSPE